MAIRLNIIVPGTSRWWKKLWNSRIVSDTTMVQINLESNHHNSFKFNNCCWVVLPPSMQLSFPDTVLLCFVHSYTSWAFEYHFWGSDNWFWYPQSRIFLDRMLATAVLISSYYFASCCRGRIWIRLCPWMSAHMSSYTALRSLSVNICAARIDELIQKVRVFSRRSDKHVRSSVLLVVSSTNFLL